MQHISRKFDGQFQRFEEILRKVRKSFESRVRGGNDAWNEKSSKEGNGICVLSFERIPPSRGLYVISSDVIPWSLSSIRSSR